MKRYIYIIIGIIVAAALAILILLWIKNRSAGPALVTTGTTTGSLPIAGTQSNSSTGSGSAVGALGLSPIANNTGASGVTGQMAIQNFGILSSSTVLDYFVDAKNNIVAIKPTGEVILISNGETTMINSSTIDNIISANFSYDGKKIFVSYGSPSSPQSGIFDTTTNTWTSLAQGMLSPQWSPTNNYQIAYLVITKSGKLALATINAASLKTAPTTLLTLNANDLVMQWPQKSEFILSDKPTSENSGSIWMFNAQTGIFNSILYDVSGAESIWSHSTAFPYGLSFSNSGSGKNLLQLQSLSGSFSAKSLTFLTLPSKCTFNQEFLSIMTSTTTSASSTAKKTASAATSTPYLALYCGIPRSSSGFSAANLPDDYNMAALFTSDDLYKINTATGDTQSLWSDAGKNMDVSDIKFFNNALFFVNRYDQKLYGLTFN